jgi:hypothetical protein
MSAAAARVNASSGIEAGVWTGWPMVIGHGFPELVQKLPLEQREHR